MRQVTNYRRDSLWDFMSEIEKAFESALPERASAPISTVDFVPAVDLQETKDHYLVSVDLPGVAEKDIKIDAQQGRLSVRGERRRVERQNEEGFSRYERSYGVFERSFSLPQDVNADAIQARFENGELEILLPKKEVAKSRAIPLNSEKGGLFSKSIGTSENEKSPPPPEKH